MSNEGPQMVWWHCGCCGWTQPAVGEPPECEECGAEDMSLPGDEMDEFA